LVHYTTLVFAVLVVPFLTIEQASAQNLALLSGDGQVVVQNNLSNYPMVVIATDASGKPQAGVPVTWSLSGPGNLSGNAQTVTGADGQASNQFVGATIYGDTAFTQSTVTASTSRGSVTFHETTSGTDLSTGSIFVQVEIISPLLGDVLTDAGSPPVVQVHVTAVHQAGVQQVPNVSMRLIPADPSGPTLACASGTGITDSNGMANCRVVFGGPAGSGAYSIEVGGFRTFSPFQFTVTHRSGQPGAIVITGGSNQSGQAGAQLPAPLTARVQDATGNALSNVSVVWQPLNPQAVSLSSVVSTSDANGMVSAIATLGSAIGPAQVQLSTAGGAAQVVFNLTVTQPQQPPVGGHGTPASILITGGNNQSGPPGAALPAPLTAKVVDAAGNPVSGAAVTWQSVNTQAISLGSVVSTSDANGIVSAVAIAGSTIGPTQVQLRTTGGGISTPFGVAGGAVIQVTFSLTVVTAQPGAGRGSLPTSFRITGGNNQSGAPGARLPVPLTAQVLDGTGAPVPNVPVVWQSLNPQSVSLSGVVSVSDGNGMVSAIATLGSLPGAAQVQLQSNASVSQTPFGPAGNPIQTNFSLTVGQSQPQPAQPNTLLILSGNNQTGLLGAQLPTPLVARVVDAFGNPAPNVAVVWQPLNPVSLTGVVSTSDSNGLVSAVVTLGFTAGLAQVQVRTVYGAIQATFNLTVNQPQPANLRILSGNNQSGSPGAQLPVPLSAQVLDASGNPVPNVAVIWQPLNQSVSLSSVITTSDANGMVSAIGTLGSSAGPAQVQLRVVSASVQTVFTLQATLTLTGISIVAGSNQQTAPGGNFAQPLTAQLLALGGAAAGFQVQFISSGAAVFISSGGIAVTDANGRATVSVQAGSTPGVATITASAGGFTTSTSFTIQAPPPAPLSFFNGASGQPGAVTPAGVLAIYGTGLAPGVSGCVAANQVLGPLPVLLSGVTVQFASAGYTASAPLYSVCNLGTGQEYVVVQAPADLPLTDTVVTVQAGGSAVGQSTAPAALASPGIFTTPMSDGVKRAALRRPDGTYVSLESPAQAGERLQAFVTGLGRPVTASGIALNTNQAGIAGDDAPPPNPVNISVAGEVLQPVTAIYATDSIGVYLITFDVPADAPSGNDTAFTVTTVLPDQSVLSDSTTLPIQ
jgi:adhesin/invasin